MRKKPNVSRVFKENEKNQKGQKTQSICLSGYLTDKVIVLYKQLGFFRPTSQLLLTLHSLLPSLTPYYKDFFFFSRLKEAVSPKNANKRFVNMNTIYRTIIKICFQMDSSVFSSSTQTLWSDINES